MKAKYESINKVSPSLSGQKIEEKEGKGRRRIGRKETTTIGLQMGKKKGKFSFQEQKEQQKEKKQQECSFKIV